MRKQKYTLALSGTRYLLGFILIIAPYLLPYYLRQELLPDYALVAIEVLSMALIALQVLKNYRIAKRFFPQLMIIILFCLILVLATAYNDGNIWSAIIKSIRIIFPCLLIGIVIIRRDNYSWHFLNTIKYFTAFFCLADIVIMLLYPNGIPSYSEGHNNAYFLYGNVNTTIKMIFPGMCCSSLIDIKKKKISFSTVLFWLCLIYQYFAVYHTGTTMVALLFISVWLIMMHFFSGKIKRLYFISLAAISILEISIVLISNTNVITFVAGLFNKSSDFTGRLILWQRVLRYIREKPILGHGQQATDSIRLYIGNASGSHNYFLDIVYQCGIIGLAFFLLLIIIPLISIRKNPDTSVEQYVLIGYCISYLIMFIMEPFFGHESTFIPIFFASLILSTIMNKNRRNTS